MPDEQQPIPPPPNDGTISAMLDIVKSVQTATQTLQDKMRKDSEEIIAKCKLVTPLGGGFREFNETGYVMQYISGDKGKELRRKVVDFIKAEVDATKTGEGGTATAAKTT